MDTDLAQLLDDLRDYFADRSDIRDGSEGRQLPNREMTLLLEIDSAIARLEKQS